jgi:uncharacterized protein (DUF58 family)
MKKIGNMLASIKQGKFLFLGFVVCIMLFILAAIIPSFAILPLIVLILFGAIALLDFCLLFLVSKKITTQRNMPYRLSNGDPLHVTITINNPNNFGIRTTLTEELPIQFQARDFNISSTINAQETKPITYTLLPKERGVYAFGNTILFVETALRIWQRRMITQGPVDIMCYPAYLQLKNYQIMAVANRLNELGVKKTRRIGASTEFEQIKEYVQGDDIRTVNWKATARKGSLMINNYTDEKSQQVYCIINKSRVMRMPFNGLTLLDYAINASLVLSHVVITRQDRIGLITYAEKNDTVILANKKPGTMNRIQEALYKQSTGFLEADLERLFSVVRQNITHRSLIVLFTNYETMPALARDMPILRRLNKYHLLLVILFENTEIKNFQQESGGNINKIYEQSIAEKFILEKKLIQKELHKFGILSILTDPKNLTINVINQYVELKNKSKI